jgi:TIR domain
MERTKIFLSYSHKDDSWRNRLVNHLAVLEYQGLVHLWADTRIEIGADWQTRINQVMAESQAALLLLTPNFLASILSEELPSLMQRHARNGMQILPVIARPCAWKLVDWLSTRQVRPRDGRALSAGDEFQIDADLTTLVYELAALIGKSDQSMALDERPITPGVAHRAQAISPEAAIEPIEMLDLALLHLNRVADEIIAKGAVSSIDISRLVNLAIHLGVPMYNLGCHFGCAYVYGHTAQLILDLVNKVDIVDDRIRSSRQLFDNVKIPQNPLNASEANERAWDLRHVFDRLLTLLASSH